MKYLLPHNLLRRQSNQFYTTIMIRSLALGMILIFEPIYMYNYFNHSLPITLLFFGLIHGIFSLIAVLGAKIMSRFGFDWAMLISHLFFFIYYIALTFITASYLLVPLAIIAKAIGMSLFWPSYHTNFARFSKGNHQGEEVGKKNIAVILPRVLGPFIGGLILSQFNYTFLFIAVLVVLLLSAVPLFMTREKNEVYTDGYQKAWSRIFKKKNFHTSIAFTASSIETGINNYIWPLFMAILSISYISIGSITSFSLFISALFIFYMGKICDSDKRTKALNIGSFLTSIAWIIKFFVITPFSAFLSHSFYKITRTSATIPYQTFFYEKATLRGGEADEFILYREITVNAVRFISLAFLALLFTFIPQINLAFVIAALASLGFVLIAKQPDIKDKNLILFPEEEE